MPTYKAKTTDQPLILGRTTDYKTIQYDLWDIVAYRVYGDERAMHHLIDANWDVRFKLGWVKYDDEFFPAGIVLRVPEQATVIVDLKPLAKVPKVSEILPWR